jgi:hypothetical protein
MLVFSHGGADVSQTDKRLESVDEEGYTECGTYTVVEYLEHGEIERCNGCWAPVVRD